MLGHFVNKYLLISKFFKEPCGLAKVRRLRQLTTEADLFVHFSMIAVNLFKDYCALKVPIIFRKGSITSEFDS